MMRRLLFVLLLFAVPAQAYDLTLRDAPAEIHFSPRGGATEALVRRIDQAQREIHVLAYSFTSSSIAAALCRAAGRGVRVEAILDRSQRTARGNQGQALADCGGHVAVDSRHAIAHNKVMVLDGRVLATGSFNFTASAEDRNAENLLILDSPELARLYLEEWERHYGHASAW